MNMQTHTNTWIGGMNMDLDISIIKDNQYSYAENIRVIANEGNTFSVLQNIEGFKLLKPHDYIPKSENIIHTNVIRDLGIVITEDINGNNKFYRFDFSNDIESPEIINFINTKLNIQSPISSRFRWESDTNIKMYFADGINQLRVIFIDQSHDVFNSNISEADINIVPYSILEPFKFIEFGTGSLKASKVQYAYQLFNTRGSETVLSPISKLIHVTSKDIAINNQLTFGSGTNEITNKSIRLNLILPNHNFERIKIYRISYFSKNNVPTIEIIDEFNLYSTNFTYEDYGSTMLSEVSIDEFNFLLGYTFIPKVIETKDNILFAGNIKEDTWDIEYDARAYRCDSNGKVRLEQASGEILEFDIKNINSVTIDKEHDCINPYNRDLSQRYVYYNSSDGIEFGGTGINVSYKFITTSLIEDGKQNNSSGYYSNDFALWVDSKQIDSMPIYNILGQEIKRIPMNIKNKIRNYTDAEIDFNFLGYHRDEIYRFGLVLRNEQGLKSPVHWIGDIRMPSNYELPFFKSETTVDGDSVTLATYPLGIRFYINNLDESVKSVEIVRCDRTINDRTIITQGALSQVINYGNNTPNLVALPYLSYSDTHAYIGYRGSGASTEAAVYDMSNYKDSEYFWFVSPEICVNRENSIDIMDKFNVIQGVMNLDSPIADPTFSKRYFASAIKTRDSSGNLIDANSGNAASGTKDVYDYRFRWGTYDFYSALLSKYYTRRLNDPLLPQATISSAKYVPGIDPFKWGRDTKNFANNAWSAFPTVIGNKVYYNWCHSMYDKGYSGPFNDCYKTGPHGIGVIFQSTDLVDKMPFLTLDRHDTATPNAIKLCNIRNNIIPYGGNTYSARQNSKYISTNVFSLNTGNNLDLMCFGGDTYLGVFDYAVLTMSFVENDYNQGSTNRAYSGSYIPVETSINLSLRNDTFQTSKTYDPSTTYANHSVQNDIIQIGSWYSQSKPLYSYNDAYSAQSTVLIYTPKSVYDIDNLHSDSRIIYSDVKTNNEVIDSWTKFRVANYLDLDNQYGQITDLFNFRNTLTYWQSNAFGVTPVNERSLITDNNPGSLTLGVGSTLSRYEYLTTKNGLKENQLRAHTSSDSTLYWYDKDRSELVGFSGNLHTVSKLKGIQSYLNKEVNFIDDPVLVYDKKYNEVLMTFDNKTLVFNEQISAFTSFYTYKPDWYFEFSKQLYLFNDNNIYIYNSGDTLGLLIGDEKISYIKFIINSNYSQTKTFDNVEYSGDFSINTNFDNIKFETKHQISEITNSNKIDYREDTYKFAIPRNSIKLSESDQLINMSYDDRMKGKYLICHYYYDCSNGKLFKVPYINTTYRYSFI